MKNLEIQKINNNNNKRTMRVYIKKYNILEKSEYTLLKSVQIL